MRSIIRNLALYLACLGLLSCSQSEEGDGLVVSGIISRAPVAGSRVTFHLINADGSPGKVVASAKTRKGKKKGNYRARIPKAYQNRPLIVRAVGGTYTENGAEVELTEMYAAVPDAYLKANANVSVSTLTDGIFRNWKANVESGVYSVKDASEGMSASAERVLTAYGLSADVNLLTVLSVAPADANATEGDSIALKMRTKMEALKEAARRQGQSGANLESYLVTIARDLEDNNGFDGRAGGEALELNSNYWDDFGNAEQEWLRGKGGAYADLSPSTWGKRKKSQRRNPSDSGGSSSAQNGGNERQEDPQPVAEPQQDDSADEEPAVEVAQNEDNENEANNNNDENNEAENQDNNDQANHNITCHYHVSKFGNDGQAGSAQAPFLTIQRAVDIAKISSGSSGLRNVCVAGGEYSEVVNWKSKVSLYGGFNPNNWNDRSSSQYVSTIRDSRNSGGRDKRPIAAVIASGTMNHAVMDGFLIIGSRGASYSAAFFATRIYRVTIQNCTFHGGNGSTQSFGIYETGSVLADALFQNNKIYGVTPGLSGGRRSYAVMSYGSQATFKNNILYGGNGTYNTAGYLKGNTRSLWQGNTIYGGQGTYSYGLYTTVGGTLKNNKVYGGSGTEQSFGLYSSDYSSPHPTVTDNEFYGGSGGQSYGMYVVGAESVVHRNKFHGGSGRLGAHGVYLNSNGTLFYNNILYGGNNAENDGDTHGLFLLNPGNWNIRNNTINGGKAGDGTSYGIYWSGSNRTYIENNIIFGDADHTDVGVYSRVSMRDGDRVLRYNVFSLSDSAYMMRTLGGSCGRNLDEDGNSTTCNIDDINALNDANGNNFTASVFLESWKGQDDNANTLTDNDWRLSAATPVSVTDGAMNGSALNFGFVEDFGQRARTAPWSLGAFEYVR